MFYFELDKQQIKKSSRYEITLELQEKKLGESSLKCLISNKDKNQKMISTILFSADRDKICIFLNMRTVGDRKPTQVQNLKKKFEVLKAIQKPSPDTRILANK